MLLHSSYEMLFRSSWNILVGIALIYAVTVSITVYPSFTDIHNTRRRIECFSHSYNALPILIRYTIQHCFFLYPLFIISYPFYLSSYLFFYNLL